jgi:hypothetical protein
LDARVKVKDTFLEFISSAMATLRTNGIAVQFSEAQFQNELSIVQFISEQMTDIANSLAIAFV